MTVPAPGGRPADAERLAAARAAASALRDPEADGVANPGAEADRFQVLHDALVDLLTAAEPDDTAGAAAGGPVPGSAPRGPG